jgi:hypothetical protein
VESNSHSSTVNDTDNTQKEHEGPPISSTHFTSKKPGQHPPSDVHFSIEQVTGISSKELDDKYSTAHPDDDRLIPSLEFNLQPLLQIVIAILEAESPAKIDLLGFGCFNKVYLFSFADGKEAVVRLPYGKKKDLMRMQVESEVVTMKYVKAKLPPNWASLVPYVFTSDPDPSNTVGAPYIVMERVAGCMLSDVWKGIEMSQKRRIVQQTADFTSALHSVGREFTDIGSLCWKDDEFYVGPSYINSLQEEYRGPWPNTRMYLMARINSILLLWQNIYFRRSSEMHTFCGAPISSILTFFSHLTELVSKFNPCKLTNDADADKFRSLVHPDLHLGNIFVDPDSLQLSAIIDWADAAIYPEWYYSSVPTYLCGPDVYCKRSPLEGYEEEFREQFMDLTHLRDFYILQKGLMEPGFKYRLDKYAVLHKLQSSFALDFSVLEVEELAIWVEEEVSEYRTGAAKLE